MAIDTDYAQSMATQLAQYSVQAQLSNLNRNEENYKAQQSALNTLDSALKAFKSSASSLKSGGQSVLVTSAKFSQEGYASASVSSAAVNGSYDFFVQQLASKSQVALSGLQDGSLGGRLKIDVGSKNFSVDLSGKATLDEVAAAINSSADNSGVKATLVRSNGAVNLVLTSEKTGADQAIRLQASGNTALESAVVGKKDLSTAQDAIVRLGGEAGLELTSSSNTFDNVIDGVSLTFTKAHAKGEAPLTIDVAKDQSATKSKAQSFLDAFNTLMDKFDTLAASGGESSARGVLAGDSSIRAVDNMLNQLVRRSFGGFSLTDFGVSADRNGKLTINAERFERALSNNPEGFETLFSGKGNLLETVDKEMAIYTSSAGGVIANRKDSLNQRMRRLDDQFDNLQKQFDSNYTRYLRQYTNMLQAMESMGQTSGMFE